jgi:NAD(P)H-quinone oxidoreductase subunit 6
VTGSATFALLAALAVAGAVAVVFSPRVLTLVLGLGVFLLAVAGLYLYFAMAFLAVAQVFLYVGGVLVLVLFAFMLLARDQDGEPELGSRHDVGAFAVSAGLFVLLIFTLRGASPTSAGMGAGTSVSALGAAMLGPLLPAFELLGVLLLTALVAVIVIVGGGESQ